MRFPERWEIHFPGEPVLDPVTGNRRPGSPPEPRPVKGLWQQVNPATAQEEFGVAALVDDGVLLLSPSAVLDETCSVVGPDGTWWRCVTRPRTRRRVRGARSSKYIAVIVRQTSDMKGGP